MVINMKSKITASLLSILLCLTLASCGEKNVMTIGSTEIGYDEYRYYLLNNKRDSFNSAESLTEEQIEELKSLTEENAKYSAAIEALAEKYGAELTDEDNAQVEAYIAAYKAEECYNNEESYESSLEMYYMTDELFKELQKDTLLVYRTMDKMVEVCAIVADDTAIDSLMASDELLCIKEIYLSYPSEETKEYVHNRAVEAHTAIMNGGDFTEIMRKYSSYNESEMSPEHGYYTTEYEMPEYIWQTAASLADGEVSEIIESPYGYHIVMRCEKDAEYMEEIREDITERYISAMYTKALYETIDSLEVEYTSYGKRLKIETIS